MGFKRPFRAEPVQLGAYQLKKQRAELNSTIRCNVLAIAIAALSGLALTYATTLNWSEIWPTMRSTLADFGFVRRHDPQPGDYFSTCDEARAEGVAPLAIGEPGYRSPLDEDGDGVACEPYRGQR
jgi:Excalibur calcium-binding domain